MKPLGGQRRRLCARRPLAACLGRLKAFRPNTAPLPSRSCSRTFSSSSTACTSAGSHEDGQPWSLKTNAPCSRSRPRRTFPPGTGTEPRPRGPAPSRGRSPPLQPVPGCTWRKRMNKSETAAVRRTAGALRQGPPFRLVWQRRDPGLREGGNALTGGQGGQGQHCDSKQRNGRRPQRDQRHDLVHCEARLYPGNSTSAPTCGWSWSPSNGAVFSAALARVRSHHCVAENHEFQRDINRQDYADCKPDVIIAHRHRSGGIELGPIRSSKNGRP